MMRHPMHRNPEKPPSPLATTKGTLNASLLHFRTRLSGQRQLARIQNRHSIDFNDSAMEIRSILPSMSRLTTSVKASTVSTLYR